MDTREKLIDARIGMLALADELKNISRACQLAGISRTHYYDIKEAFERYGRDGLAPTVRRRPRMPNETPSELVARILDMTAEYPTYSYVRISQQLRLVGVPASAAQVRGVWAREGLLKRFDRLLWLERRVAEHGGPLTESVMKLLRQHARQTLDPQGQIEAPTPGYLGCQDTYYVGTLKGVGRVYAQTFIDANAAVGFAKLYLSKVPMTAVDLLHDRVLPFYDAHGVALERVLTDNGREYCGRPLTHPFELYCTVQQIQHRTTRVGSPESNGMVERFNRTLKEEFFAVAYRKQIYETVEALQADLDAFLAFYNEGRAHQGYRTQGRTPYQTFLEHQAAQQRAAEAPQAA
jgi:transposase InsO family protein